MTVRNEMVRKGLTLGAEFALSVIALIFLGYFLGAKISESMAMVGMILGAFLGLALGTYLLIKAVE
ncbi:MAG: hypothetical protein DRO76_05460 [Candidatus Altiarchaeales archaeon]|nr:MAG: hypothetical protein DRO76_05460 [Candidatus Altiarchaeales archaeon]